MKRALLLFLLTLVACIAAAQERLSDQIYMKSGGAAFTLDVFKSNTPNAPCVIWLVSGGWFSDHKDINLPIAQLYNQAGITVIEVVHGSQPRYTLNEIIPQIKRSIRYIRTNAERFGIDPNKIGISGASAGGHLSLMMGGTGDAGNPSATDPVEKAASHVNAVGVLMPPTDFLNWGKPGYMPIEDPQMTVFLPAFGVNKDTPKDKFSEIAKLVSPIAYVTAKFPPTMIVHGDKDTLVPIQQAQVMDVALGKSGVDHELVTVVGGGHDGKTFFDGLPRLLAFFKAKLK